MTGGVASTVIRRHAPDSQSRRSGIRRGLMMGLFILGAWGRAGASENAETVLAQRPCPDAQIPPMQRIFVYAKAIFDFSRRQFAKSGRKLTQTNCLAR
jgi:hypothetical protein